MKALVLQGERDIRVESVADPTPPDVNGAVVKITRTAICGSDLHLYHAELAPAGLRLGHEFIGEVVEVGRGVTRFRPGDRVLTSGVIGCGRCRSCLAGDVVSCTAGGLQVFGIGFDLPGGQAEAAAVPNADFSLLAIPESMTDEQAVLLTDILPTGWYGAQQADISPGDTVAVVGLGPVGIEALLSAQLMGAARVLAVDSVPDRLQRAASLGAIPVDATDGAGVAGILEATGGRGADSVIEAVGTRQAILDAIGATRPGGTISVVGANMEGDFPFPMGLAFFRDLTFRIGLCPVPKTWPQLIPLIANGRLHPEIVVTHRMSLSEGPEAYRMFNAREPGVLKVVLDTSL